MAALSATVDPDGTGDYTSLDAMDTGEGQDLTDGGGDTFTATCESSSGTADTTALVLSNWTTAAANYVKLIAKVGDEALKTGWDASRYRISVTDAHVMQISEDFVRVDGLQIEYTYTDTSGHGIRSLGVGAGATLLINKCRFQMAGGASPQSAVALDDVDVTLTMTNCIADAGWERGLSASAGTGHLVYNCIIYGCADDGIRAANTAIKNCAIWNNPDDIRDDGGCTIDYNATDDGDGTNSQSPANWALEYVNAAGGDFTTIAGADLENNGVGPGSDANVPTPDIDGTTRAGASCDIGADEIAAVGGSPVASILQQHAA